MRFKPGDKVKITSRLSNGWIDAHKAFGVPVHDIYTIQKITEKGGFDTYFLEEVTCIYGASGYIDSWFELVETRPDLNLLNLAMWDRYPLTIVTKDDKVVL